jgi:lysophospholipase L1-like esterase
MRRPLVAAVSVLATMALLEAVARIVAPSASYFVLVPETDWTIAEAPDVVRGIEGISRYRVNSFGIRGRAFGPDDSEYRILAVGGSTTECAQLDDTEVWTALLENALDPMAPITPITNARRVWVGNVGRSGLTAREHVLHLEHLLPEYPRIDVVLSMVGVNDMLSALKQGARYQPPPPEPDRARAFVLYPRWSALWQTVDRLRASYNRSRAFGPDDANGLTQSRRARQVAEVWIDDLPDLEEPLEVYRRNLNAMADIASVKGVRLVFITQPSRWREHMSEEESRELWFGWVGEDWPVAEGYFTTGALERAMAAYNEGLLGVCRERGLDCVDAAATMGPDAALFYDDVHFTEAGSRRLAGVLAAHLKR